MVDIQKEREAFESWLFDEYERAINFDIVFCEHEQAYNHVPTQARWETWQAAKAQSVPEGFVLVPKEPTEEMIDAGVEESDVDWKRLKFAYQAMIGAVE